MNTLNFDPKDTSRLEYRDTREQDHGTRGNSNDDRYYDYREPVSRNVGQQALRSTVADEIDYYLTGPDDSPLIICDELYPDEKVGQTPTIELEVGEDPDELYFYEEGLEDPWMPEGPSNSQIRAAVQKYHATLAAEDYELDFDTAEERIGGLPHGYHIV